MKKVNKVKNNDTPLMVTIEDIIKTPAASKSSFKADNKINNFVKKAKSLSVEEMKKQSEANFAAKTFRENSLITAYTEKKLKSQSLIKEAQALIKAKEKATKTSSKEKKEVKATE